MEGFPKQENKFEINTEQQEVVDFLNSEMEEAIMALQKTPEDKKRIKDFMDERMNFQSWLEKEGLDFEHLYLWHVLVGGTIHDTLNITAFDTSNGDIERFFKEKLLPIIKKG